MTQSNPMLESLQEILPRIAENADKAEELRQMPQENVDLLKGIRMHHAFLPKAYGGLEMSLPDFAQCIVALSGACCSTAWAFSLLCTHSHQLALFSKECQDEVWGDNNDATACSSIAPLGRYEETEGGVRFSGNMSWSSGSDHAEWAIVGFNRMVDDEKVYCFAAIPRADYEIIDDWYAMAVKGSGTKTLKIEDVFVPEHRISVAKDMMEGKSKGFGLYPDSKIFYTPYRPYFASGFAAMALGTAERMLTIYREYNAKRIRAYTGAEVKVSIPMLTRLAESTHQVDAARAYLEKTWEEHKDHSERHEYPSKETLTYWRTNQAYAIKMCNEATDRLWKGLGASNWMLAREGQRVWRDNHITAAHAYTDYDVCTQILGRELMGLAPDPGLL
jgi:alkylation response protein AidB-like acyl-CoA dehydrogenase